LAAGKGGFRRFNSLAGAGILRQPADLRNSLSHDFWVFFAPIVDDSGEAGIIPSPKKEEAIFRRPVAVAEAQQITTHEQSGT